MLPIDLTSIFRFFKKRYASPLCDIAALMVYSDVCIIGIAAQKVELIMQFSIRKPI